MRDKEKAEVQDRKMARDFSPFIFNEKPAGEGKYLARGRSEGPEFPAEDPRELKGIVPHTLKASIPKDH